MMAGDGLLLDVADAVATRQQVDWDRARGAARRDQRRSLDNLRALSEMATSVGARTPSGPDTAGSRDPLGTPFLRIALGALVAVAAVQVAAGLVRITWSWEQRWGLQFAEPRMLALVSLSACAALLLIGGRRDRRARLLGVVFALGASSFSTSFSWPLVSLALPCTRIQGWTNQLPPCSVTAWSIRTRYYRPFVRLSRKLASSGLWRRRR